MSDEYLVVGMCFGLLTWILIPESIRTAIVWALAIVTFGSLAWLFTVLGLAGLSNGSV